MTWLPLDWDPYRRRQEQMDQWRGQSAPATDASSLSPAAPTGTKPDKVMPTGDIWAPRPAGLGYDSKPTLGQLGGKTPSSGSPWDMTGSYQTNLPPGAQTRGVSGVNSYDDEPTGGTTTPGSDPIPPSSPAPTTTPSPTTTTPSTTTASPWQQPAAASNAATSSNAPRLSQGADGVWVLTEHGNRRPLQPSEVAAAQKYVTDFWTKFPTGFQPGNPNSVADAYKQFLGREATAAELASHAGNPNGLAGIISTIANSPEAKAYAERVQNGTAGTTGTTGTTGGTTPIPNNDPAALLRGMLGSGASSPEALAKLEPELAKYGIKLQKDSAGVIRGRLYLPDGTAIDVVNNNGWGQPWTIINRGKSSGDAAASTAGTSSSARYAAMTPDAPMDVWTNNAVSPAEDYAIRTDRSAAVANRR